MNVTAVCLRSGDWWAVTVPEIEGGFTQAKRLDQVADMVADLVELATGTPRDQVQVTLDAHVAGDARKHWTEARRLEEQARRLEADAAALARDAVADLRGRGLSVRDVGTLLDVSPQRVSQLNTTGRTFVFTGFTQPGGLVTTWDAHVVKHAVAPGDKHKALCGAPLSETREDQPFTIEHDDGEDVCEECARRAL